MTHYPRQDLTLCNKVVLVLSIILFSPMIIVMVLAVMVIVCACAIGAFVGYLLGLLIKKML